MAVFLQSISQIMLLTISRILISNGKVGLLALPLALVGFHFKISIQKASIQKAKGDSERTTPGAYHKGVLKVASIAHLFTTH